MKLKNLDKLHVLTVISNPMRYKARYDLFNVFEEDITRKGAQLWTGELASGARKHAITHEGNFHHIQWSSSTLDGEIWLKERMINLLIQQLTNRCPDWRYLFVTDADVKYEKGVLEETAQMLQHYDFVQPWSRAIDMSVGGLGALNGVTVPSFMYCYVNGIEWKGSSPYLLGGHPGYSFAIRREALNWIGLIPDFGLAGSGDRHLMASMIGNVSASFHHDIHWDYKRMLHQFENRCEKNLKRNVGYVDCFLRHGFHGFKRDRQYGERWKILVEHQYSPIMDLKIDAAGMYQLVVESPRQMRLRDDLRKYFKSRNEDSR